MHITLKDMQITSICQEESALRRWKNYWCCPAVVTGSEGNKVRVRLAGSARTVPSCRVLPLTLIEEQYFDKDQWRKGRVNCRDA